MDEARARRRQPEVDLREFPTVGALLKATRENAGLSLAEVAERTHIKQNFLDAIEQMATGQLPSRPFAVGFVNVYARQLGLNADEVARRWKEETGGARPVEIEPEKYEAVRREEPELERQDMPLWFALAVIAFILWCVIKVVTTAHERSTPFSFAPQRPAAAVAPTPRAVEAEPAPNEPQAPAITGLPAEPVAAESPAKAIERIAPIYPQRCETLANPVETVEVAFNVTRRGVVTSARVAASSNQCFNEAALNAIRRWQFQPKMENAVAKPAYDLRYTFRFDRPQ
jgi:TonB family protein